MCFACIIVRKVHCVDRKLKKRKHFCSCSRFPYNKTLCTSMQEDIYQYFNYRLYLVLQVAEIIKISLSTFCFTSARNLKQIAAVFAVECRHKLLTALNSL